MNHLVREQRLDKNGVLNTKLVRPQGAQPARSNAFPPVAVPASSRAVYKAFGQVFTDPAGIAWDRMSNDDVSKIADFAGSELEKNKKNANAMFDLYAEMFRNENVDSQHVKELLDGNDVLQQIKDAFVEANGLDAEEWTPEQYDARKDYIQHYMEFTKAYDEAEFVEDSSESAGGWG